MKFKYIKALWGNFALKHVTYKESIATYVKYTTELQAACA